jgi:hypothetical protein
MSGTSENQLESVFISYAREDSVAALRLYEELKRAGLWPWLDKEDLLPGQDWSLEISKAVRKSRYLIALFSSTSVQKRGYIQREFKLAVDVLDEFPEGKIFAIPARLDDCEIPYEKFRNIKRVDLFPSWEEGIRRILRSFGISVEDGNVKPLQILLPLFRGEKKIFVDREEYIDNRIKEYLKPSSRVSIISILSESNKEEHFMRK